MTNGTTDAVAHRFSALCYAIPTCFLLLMSVGCHGELSIISDDNGAPGQTPGVESPGGTAPGSTEPGEVQTPEEPLQGPILTADDCVDAELSPGPAPLRRLTTVEYVNTVAHTLGVDISAEASALPHEPLAEGFSNTADALIPSAARTVAYASIAETVVEKIVDWEGFIGQYTTCTDFEATCRNGYIDGLGLRLFRRPLTNDELALFGPIFDIVQSEGDGFRVAAQLVLRAMMQSPQFLYRLETQAPGADFSAGELRALGDFEIASRLSYLVWNSSPDETLLQAASAGELRTPEQIEAQVERMLNEPKATLALRKFVRDWLALDELDHVDRSSELYPEFSRGVLRDMKEETLRFFEHLVWEKQDPMMSMFEQPYTFATERLANLYGLESLGEGFEEYDLSGNPHRVGLLTQGSLLAVSAGKDHPSLVERGLYMLDTLLCGVVTSAPPEVLGAGQPVTEGLSQRESLAEHSRNPSCAGCHAQFDPLGHGLEPYDALGSYLTEDFYGNPLRGDGIFSSDEVEVPFDEIHQFARVLTESPTVQDCMVKKPLQYALGRPLTQSDACTLADVKQRHLDQGGNYQEMILAIALHPNFRHIRVED
ncbi:MAG: DUF1592 domain-containing protein [Bradymonadaceae bacterium]